MKFFRKLRGFFRSEKLEADMAEEMRAHLEMQVQENLRQGMASEEARYAARRQFGHVAGIQERCRDQRGWVWLEQARQDLGYALRGWRKNPGFTAVAVLTLGLGIGSCTAIFSVVNAVLLRPLGYFESDRLVVIKELTPPPNVREGVVSPRNFLDWEQRTTSFSAMAAYANDTFNFTGGGEPRQLTGLKVTARYLDVFGIRPVLGRGFLSAEDSPGAERAVVIGAALWQQNFGGANDVIGQTMRLDGEAFTIVGVMPAMPGTTEIWLPMVFTPDQISEENRGAHWLNVAARLKPGIPVAQAEAEIKLLASQISTADSSGARWSAVVLGLQENAVRDGRTPLLMLLGAVGCVLLIACANVSNLLLARATVRRQEISIRTALGAGRGRLVRQLLSESFLLAAAGGIFGLFLAWWGLQAAVPFAPRGVSIELDGRALAFAFAVSFAAGFGFGFAPAWLSTRGGIGGALKQSGRGTTDGSARHLRGALIVGEIAMTVLLLSLAGLLGRSFLKLMRADLGFNPEHALVARLSLPQKKYARPEQQSAFVTALVERVRGLPGVRAAGVSHVLPLVSNQANGFSIQGQASAGGQPITGYFAVTPDYFSAMGIRLVEGRLFNAQDDARATRVAIVNETLARQYFPGGTPLGQRINFTDDANAWREIVGVVADVAQHAVNRTVPCQSYEPFAQQPRPTLNLVVRFASPDDGSDVAKILSGLLRPAVYAVDHEQPVGTVALLDEILAGGLARARFTVMLLGTFSLVALVIATVGLYGVMAYTVTQRRGEFGIRLALGARPADVLHLVLRQGSKLVGLGLTIGIGVTVAGARLVQSLLFHTSAYDPVTLGSIASLLAAVAFFACYLPARRAAGVDPMVALRCE